MFLCRGINLSKAPTSQNAQTLKQFVSKSCMEFNCVWLLSDNIPIAFLAKVSSCKSLQIVLEGILL